MPSILDWLRSKRCPACSKLVPRNAPECPACHIEFSNRGSFHGYKWTTGKPESLCPRCRTSLKAHVPVCPNCTQEFAMDGQRWENMRATDAYVFACPCRLFRDLGLKKNAPSCSRCGIEFKLKNGIWEKDKDSWAPEPAQIYPFICPYCSCGIKVRAKGCDRCGVFFRRVGGGKLEINVDFQIEYLDKIFSACESEFEGMWSLSTERYLEVFEAIEHGAVHPVAFLREMSGGSG